MTWWKTPEKAYSSHRQLKWYNRVSELVILKEAHKRSGARLSANSARDMFSVESSRLYW